MQTMLEVVPEHSEAIFREVEISDPVRELLPDGRELWRAEQDDIRAFYNKRWVPGSFYLRLHGAFNHGLIHKRLDAFCSGEDGRRPVLHVICIISNCSWHLELFAGVSPVPESAYYNPMQVLAHSGGNSQSCAFPSNRPLSCCSFGSHMCQISNSTTKPSRFWHWTHYSSAICYCSS
jgi:hypothetical protein